ncbi:MAG: hypothetical protein H0Z29_05440 [Candidatus Marinimicrobia bacterium]|nr:hypothetical protein [Candidatus Neomarinimicrobiota bacterium]
MNFVKKDGYASIYVDATKDKMGIWWALIRRCISNNMDLSLIQKNEYEFRVEARVRVSSAPKRINLHLNTQRTTDFHTHLMEYDIPDTTNWHVISMTTKNFDARPGDHVFGQLALMDWGLEKYRVDIDYYKVDIVRIDTIVPDKGNPLPYHPKIPDLKTFEYKIPVSRDGLINLTYPELKLYDWKLFYRNKEVPILSVSNDQYATLEWDLNRFKGKKVKGFGVIELTTHSVIKLKRDLKDFGIIRVSEVYNNYCQHEDSLSLENFCGNKNLYDLINSQMIIDVEVKKKGKTLIAINNAVLTRMINGITKGIALKPLGAIIYSFYPHEYKNGRYQPYLYLNLEE